MNHSLKRKEINFFLAVYENLNLWEKKYRVQEEKDLGWDLPRSKLTPITHKIHVPKADVPTRHGQPPFFPNLVGPHDRELKPIVHTMQDASTHLLTASITKTPKAHHRFQRVSYWSFHQFLRPKSLHDTKMTKILFKFKHPHIKINRWPLFPKQAKWISGHG